MHWEQMKWVDVSDSNDATSEIKDFKLDSSRRILVIF